MSAEYSYAIASNPVYYDQSRLHVLFAGESQTHPGHSLGPKLYDYYLLHFVESGKGVFRTEQQSYSLQTHDCFLIHPEQLVSYASSQEEPWKYRWAAFTGSASHGLVRQAGFTTGATVFRAADHSRIPEWIECMQQGFNTRKSSSHTAAIGYLHLIMAEAMDHLAEELPLAGPESHLRSTVRQMIQYMGTQYAHPVSIEDMAAGLGYNRAYLSRIFKQETGVSPVTYLLKLRIDKSRQLLRERPGLSIEQVAASVGMQDALYFSRQFSRLYGQSPSEYRRSVLAGSS